MPIILNTKSIYYNDVNLIAQIGKVKSRSDVPKELNRIVVSPMMAIVGKTFAMEAARLGLTVCLHRFGSIESQREIYESINCDNKNKYNTRNVYCSIGLDDLERVKYLSEFSGVRNWCLDIASGYLPQIYEKLKQIVEVTNIDSLIIGNVHTLEGVKYLNDICESFNIKHKIFRVGIAGGTPCSTSDVVGVNRGQITEIIECSKKGHIICADGGISKPSFACKAYAAGASFVMLGGYWMKAKESESNLNGDGSYWGGASHKNQLLSKGKIFKHSEGKEIPKQNVELVPLKSLVDDLWGGISSYISYSGYDSLTKVIGQGVFELKENSLPPKNR